MYLVYSPQFIIPSFLLKSSELYEPCSFGTHKEQIRDALVTDITVKKLLLELQMDSEMTVGEKHLITS